jgi:hypothetical protein
VPVELERMRGAPISWACRGRIRQDMERMRPSEGHSPLETAEERIRRDTRRMRPCEVCQLAGARRGRDLLGKGEGETEGRALTSVGCRGGDMLRHGKKRPRKRCQHIERKWPREVYTPSRPQREGSGCGKKVNEQGVLTIRRPQEGDVRGWKESN